MPVWTVSPKDYIWKEPNYVSVNITKASLGYCVFPVTSENKYLNVFNLNMFNTHRLEK